MAISSIADLLARIDRGGIAFAAAFRKEGDSSARAVQLAEVLRALWPAAALTACLLRDGRAAVVLDQGGRPSPELATQLLTERAVGSPAGEIGLDNQLLLVEPAVIAGRWFGALAVSAPANGGTAAKEETRALLSDFARQLSLHFELEERQREVHILRERLAEENALAAIGELAGPVVHEFNNLLNTMLLQVAVMEQKVDESLLPDLRTIRRQGAGVIALVKQWQQCRRRPAATQCTLDVNSLIEEAAAVDPAVALDLTPRLPAVPGHATDFRRLVTFLLDNARAVSGGNRVVVRTESAGDGVVFRVEDSGPAIPTETLPRLFEALGEDRPGTKRLELATCRTLVRRLQGKIRGENRTTGGVTVVVELPAAGH
jgi:signal transduction histidine kinase